MSVYIKGMEMPKGCAICPYCDRAWNKPKCKAKSVQGRFMEQRLNLDRTRQKWCPLVPIPDHGRLIDAFDTVKTLCNKGFYMHAEVVSDMPTIIPADKEAKE